MNLILRLVIAGLLVTILPAVAAAVTIEGVAFDEERVESNQPLKLRGAGLFRYMLFIKAYAGALYLPEKVPSDKALADIPKRLEVSYFHPINGEDFGPATISGIQKNVDEETFQRIQPQIELHNSLYVDVKPGDRYALTYIPGQGTTLALNGKDLGIIPGAEFASALFSIWLGSDPISKQFKSDILGKG